MALGFDWAEFCLVENEQLKLIGIRGGSKGIPVMPLSGPGIVVKAAKTKATVMVSDTRKDATYVDHEGFDWGNDPTMLSELAVPVLVEDQCVAVLNTESSVLNAFGNEEQTLLEILAFHVGLAFRRLKYQEKLRALHQHTSSLALAKTYDEVVKLTLDAMEFTLGFTHAGFEEINSDCVRIRGVRGMPLSFETLTLDGPGVVVQAAKTKRAIRVSDTTEETMFVDSKVRSANGETVPMLSELAVPVIVDDSAVAVLNVESVERNKFSEQDEILLGTLANHLASAITRIRRDETLRRYTEHLEELVEERTKKLSESEKKFRELADLLPEIVIEADLEGCLTFVNQFGLSHLGFDPNELVNVMQLLVPEERDRISGQLKAGSYEEVSEHEHTVVKKDGDRVPVIMHVAPIKREGEPTGFRGVVVDISERKRLEQRLAESQRLAAIGETATWVGHDLRNPLQVTATTLFLVKKLVTSDKVEDQNVALRLLDELDNQVHYMDKIVSDLQDYARPIDAATIETNLGALIHSTLSNLIIPTSVSVAIDVQDELPRAMVNPVLLKRILINLVTNAVQAMPTGGKLTVEGNGTEDSVIISVKDTGQGIPKENLAKLFKPFFTTKARGQGLGLAVCKRLIEAQGGTITVNSEEGKGSTFTFEVPTNVTVRVASPIQQVTQC
jgi:PAS domain S-box-containing protein